MILIKDLGMKFPNPTSKQKSRYGLYECPSCGREKEFRTQNVKTGSTTQCRSCSTIAVNKRVKIKHNESHSSLYGRWIDMKQRCYNQKTKNFRWYGAKGITVCEEWKDNSTAFIDWANANGYKKELTLDKDIGSERLNISPAIYSPETCKWITTKEQNKERDKRKNNGN